MSFLIGLLAGAAGGLLGIGGGFVMIPLMVGVLKMGQHRAHGTSLAAMVFVGIGGSVTYALNGSIDVLASVFLATTAMMTAHFGARHANALTERRLRQSFGVFLIVVTILLFAKPFLPHLSHPVKEPVKVVVFLITGALTGFLSGMMGVGGAVIMIPAMVLLAGLDQHTAQGSSLLTMVPAGAVGAWTHMRYGNVDARLLKGLVPGILLGTYLGGAVAHSLDEGVLRIVFAALVLLTAYRYLKLAS